VIPVVAPALLVPVGFGAAGPIAGSLATAWQASIGNVAAGSLFATLQSISMGGAIPTGVSAMGAAVGAAVGAAAGWGSNNPGGEDDADAGTAGEDGAPPATGSSASSKSGASAAGGTDGDGDKADPDPDPDAGGPTPVGVDVPRTGLDRCDKCKREHKRNCWHR